MLDTDWDRIKGQLRSLWPLWTPSDDELDIWARRLQHREYEAVTAAVEAAYCDQGKAYRQPDMKGVFKAIKEMPAEGGVNTPAEAQVVFKCVCLEDRFRPFKVGQRLIFWAPNAKAVPDPQRAMQYATDKCAQLSEVEGITWGLVLTESGDLDQGAPAAPPFDQTALRGAQALREAEAIIAAGDDSPARRFLEKVYRKKASEQRSVALGDMLGADYQEPSAEQRQLRKQQVMKQLGAGV